MSTSGKYVLLIIAISLAFLTNPTVDGHKKTLKAELYEVVDTSMENGFINNLAKGVIKEYINVQVDMTVTCEDWYLFSLTKLNDEDDVKTVGFGLFANVIIFDGLKDEVRAELIN